MQQLLLLRVFQQESGRYGKTIVAQNVFITNSNSVPKINGDWEIYDVDYSLKTFRLRNTMDATFFARGNNQPNSAAAWTAFTNHITSKKPRKNSGRWRSKKNR